MTKTMDPRVVEAVTFAVHAAIEVVGISGLRETSMFPSAGKREELKRAA